MQNPQTMEQDIIAFINNPAEENTEKIHDYLHKLSGMKYNSQITYKSPKYCALSGVELEEDFIIIDNHYFSPKQISSYYLRDGILDVSIGDLHFIKYGNDKEIIKIELTWEILNKIYGKNLNQSLKEAYDHFNQRTQQPVTFKCELTGRSGVISEQKIVNGKQVCSEYAAHQKKEQLSEEKRKQVDSSQGFQQGAGNSQYIY
ncbi:unnamed protein product [Paramecium pentaurelia]|uniref:Uncharacterized protein n=1 Tax=Paramecium pentaurelia TaxID=43138 RepID=A0A8S1TNC9_9CILI|nr:unnamed protein product [Paramecium pentaurelia]